MAEGTSERSDLHDELGPKPPAITAAFLVIFDVRKGYTISWQRSLDGVELDGVVDYKSLPSGLHNVEEDLVYFVHGDFVGISAFLNRTASEAERHARMLAVGVLVSLEQGRSWRHAEGLKKLVDKQADDPDNFDRLEEYWNQYQQTDDDEEETAIDSLIDRRRDEDESAQANGHHEDASEANGYQKTRSLSMNTVLPADQTLAQHHPALAIPDMLELFGPLTFQVYRAALLRKRILIVGAPPVERNCHYVYAISILSSISRSSLNFLPPTDHPDIKLRSLFNVTVQDIAILEPPTPGWVACTTDDVLASKPAVFDLLVLLPPTNSNPKGTKVYPRLIPSTPELVGSPPSRSILATRRDATRYLKMQSHIRQLPSSNPESSAVDDPTTTASNINEETNPDSEMTTIIESTPWPLIVYTSLMWWASAGEEAGDNDTTGEEDADARTEQLLHKDTNEGAGKAMTKEVAIVACFHRFTAQIFGVLGDAVRGLDEEGYRDEAGDANENENENDDDDDARGAGEDDRLLSTQEQQNQQEHGNGDRNQSPKSSQSLPTERDTEEATIEISADRLSSLGLDVWSRSDRVFVAEMGRIWFSTHDRKVKLVVHGGWIGGEGGGLECCGIRVW